MPVENSYSIGWFSSLRECERETNVLNLLHFIHTRVVSDGDHASEIRINGNLQINRTGIT